ncbi:hypothetical protein ACEVOW_003286 [Salmonella enterica]|uniref:Uncharacterized protein n=8 Tax=Enterobacteriaceae TaxID=543 RepID=A0A5X7XMX0_SALDE|nr:MULTISPECIES: hypothetical protein [Enterobacteriaceae]EBM9646027.1 hypothetical protein [Salmonella enterica subsp. enterica serovar Typhimurium]EBN3542302.1 hypothetical protein [Salmonella enterica subsp. enterica serovar Newport]EBS6605114.1 hypothetical protein [Salmonella enterica subsp. enterica serovar Indiana]EBW4357305.1 hypothetical protein [Salmonella enterica subsp. enterica serovar Kintambo]EBY8082437.1 hypothetical protein [Salmonella enterica subsp. enterica serovar Banana]
MSKDWQILKKSLSYPFDAIRKNKREFFIWIVFTVVCGQMGIIANIIIRYYSHSIPLDQSIYIEGSSGSFYTFSIALIASALGPMFVTFFSSKLEFKTIKIISIILLIILLQLSGIIYAATQSKDLILPNSNDLTFGLTQPIIYVISIVLVGYTFGVLKLNATAHTDIDDESYIEKEDATVIDQTMATNEVTDDGKGVMI